MSDDVHLKRFLKRYSTGQGRRINKAVLADFRTDGQRPGEERSPVLLSEGKYEKHCHDIFIDVYVHRGAHYACIGRDGHGYEPIGSVSWFGRGHQAVPGRHPTRPAKYPHRQKAA